MNTQTSGVVVALHEDHIELVARDISPEEAESVIKHFNDRQQLAAFFPVAAASAGMVVQVINQTGIIPKI